MNVWRLSRLSILMAMLCALIPGAGAGATDRFYPDITVASPDERYLLEAKSPDNAGGPRPFARNFVYTLTDTHTGDVVWRRAQPEREASPVSVYLHDDGWVTIRTGSDHLLVLDPVTADVVVNFSILGSFTQQERDDHVAQTTAGPMWAGHSRWYYLEHEGRLLFVIRPVWGRRLIVDIGAGGLLPRDDPAIVDACRGAEQDFVRSTLAEAAADVAALDASRDYRRISDVMAAIIMAAKNRDEAAIKPLQALQRSNYSGSSGGWWDVTGEYGEGEINPFDETQMTIRRACHDALRLLGQKPVELPCTRFRPVDADGRGDYVPLATLPAPRATRVDLVRPGAAPREVLGALGAPDYINFADTAWEYHIDTDEPYTLQVIFADKRRVDRLERLVPAVWQRGDQWLKRLR